jgi:hypothetical protein
MRLWPNKTKQKKEYSLLALSQCLAHKSSKTTITIIIGVWWKSLMEHTAQPWGV